MEGVRHYWSSSHRHFHPPKTGVKPKSCLLRQVLDKLGFIYWVVNWDILYLQLKSTKFTTFLRGSLFTGLSHFWLPKKAGTDWSDFSWSALVHYLSRIKRWAICLVYMKSETIPTPIPKQSDSVSTQSPAWELLYLKLYLEAVEIEIGICRDFVDEIQPMR